MILHIYVAFWLLTLFLLVYGHWTKSSMHQYIAYTFMFLLGGALEPILPGTVEYKSGQNEFNFNTYGLINATSPHWDNETGDPSTGPPPGQAADEVFLLHIENDITYTYTTFEDHFYGFYIMILAAFGFVFTLVTRRRQGDEEEGVENYA